MNASCSLNPFDEEHMHGLKAATIVSAFLSLGGSAFIVATWYLQRGTRRALGMHVIFCLSLADALSSLTFIVDGLSPTGVLDECGGTAGGFCALLAALSQFSGLAAILWT